MSNGVNLPPRSGMPPPPPPPMSSGPKKKSGLAITSFVLSVLFFLPFIPLIGAILGIVAVATHKPDRSGRGLAIAAIPTGFIVTLIIQMMAAVAIPAFIGYIRKSKQVEVNEQLDRCARGVLDYFERPHTDSAGNTFSQVLPFNTARICPASNPSPEALNGDGGFLEYPPSGQDAYKAIQWVNTDLSYACYQFSSDSPGKPPTSGIEFKCEAWTDLDDDDVPAHWLKIGTFREDLGAFSLSPTMRDESSGYW